MPCVKLRPFLAAVLLGLGVFCPDARAAALQFMATDLGDGFVFGAAGDVSGDGSVVAGWATRTSDNASRAFRWTAAGGVELIPTPAGWDSAAAPSVSRDGQTIGIDLWKGNVAQRQAARWTLGTGVVNITPPPGGSGDSMGPRPNADGSVISGWYTYDNAFHDRVYRFTPAGGAVALPLPAGFNDSVAAAISDDGQTIAGRVRMSDTAEDRAAVWRGGSVQLLPGAEGVSSSATAVSADGSVVVGLIATPSGDGVEPFRWTAAGGLQRLGVPAGALGAQPSDVSADGSVIVGTLANYTGDGDPVFVWDAEHGMRGLRDILNGADLDTTGVRFLDITGVSSDGLTFVGSGSRDDVLRPFVAAVPEPGGVVTALAGVALILRRWRP